MIEIAGATTYFTLKEGAKPVDRIVKKDVFLNSNPPKNILVADNYRRITISADADFIPDVSHGYVTSNLIEQNLCNANVYKKEMSPSLAKILSNNKTTFESFATLFSALSQKNKEFDVINLSCGIDTKIKNLSKELNLELTAQNLAEKRQEIKQAMNNYKGNFKIFEMTLDKIAQLINHLDTIASKGTKIYISAGNNGKEYVNLFNLANNTINVGALDSNGEKAIYSSDNSLVNRWENGDVFFKKVEDGYDFTGDSIADIKFSEVAIPFKLKAYPFKVSGTSFACPRAIVKDLKNE